jgi:hypothetical protein
MSHVRAQKKNQNARQAMVISGLNTIYRNTSRSHAIKTNQQSESRIYLLDISLDDINTNYAKIHQIIEKGSSVNGNGHAKYQVKTKTEHLIITETDIYEINLSHARGKGRDREQRIYRRVPVDGDVSINELNLKVNGVTEQTKHYNIPVLIDESYYELNTALCDTAVAHIPPNHTYMTQVKKTIKFHAGSPNAFVFVYSSDGGDGNSEQFKKVIDFYMTTEDGIISLLSANSDKLNQTFKEDLISFLLQFKLCS